MWPQRRIQFNESWERKKDYLIRSLFEDVPLLSPVQEAEESVSDDSSDLGLWNPVDEVKDSRPYSPLPPLIIERVPNYHDETEEYYKELEIKMKKLYRKLFVEGRNESSVDSGDDSKNISPSRASSEYSTDAVSTQGSGSTSNNGEETENQTKSTIELDNQTNDDFDTIIENNNCAIINGSNSSDGTSRSGHDRLITSDSDVVILKDNLDAGDSGKSSKSNSGCFRRITIEAEIHREPDSISETVKLSPENTLSSHVRNEKVSVEEYMDSPDNDSPVSPEINSNDGIEIMRSAQIISAHEFESKPPSHSYDYSSASDESGPYREFEHEISEELNISDIGARITDFDRIMQTSTPNHRKRRESFIFQLSNPVIPVKKHKNAAVQVNEENYWSLLSDRFFVGKPKIFRLCSCVNHFCDC
ncbi:uncharacterized protein LOC105841476 isoform X1 [Bombyx mori]|uniref:Uncharacterized protein n=1 Tax=Bombyx mori TaxID=7091 RepID=A0A8R2DJZ5_BOMMO|nr:uncharacterized protein LOC105841476 isoform X1 [Bombyx mori]